MQGGTSCELFVLVVLQVVSRTACALVCVDVLGVAVCVCLHVHYLW